MVGGFTNHKEISMAGLLRAAMWSGVEGLGRGLSAGLSAWTAAQHQRALDEARALRAESLTRLKHGLENQDRRAIGETMRVAGEPVTENFYDEGGEIPITRTPSREQVLEAGSRKALELGDLDSYKSLTAAGNPKLTKVGQDESIVNARGEIVFRNTAGEERRTSEAQTKHDFDVERDRLKADREHSLRLQLENFKLKNGSDKTTAMMNNIKFMTENGIAEDSKQAFEMLRTQMEKPEQDAIGNIARELMRSPRYRGTDGQARAIEDASRMYEGIRARRPGGGRGFQSAEDVRAAYQAGRIDRNRAVRELQRFGYTE